MPGTSTHPQEQQPAADNWVAEPWRAPQLNDGDTLVYDEHGRVLDNTCYRSHWFRLVIDRYSGPMLLVKHGGGQERFKCGWSKRIVSSLAGLDSDSRYFLLHQLHKMRCESRTEASDKTAMEYRQAFVDGRLKKRKLPRTGKYKVWIEPKPRNHS